MTTKKFRASRIGLDIPREGDPAWVNVIVQVNIKDADYKTVQVIDRADNITRKLEDFAQDTVSFTDPITGAPIIISGAGVGMSISEFVKTWMVQDIPNTSINAMGDVVQGV
ncbi:hypothetical protein UFOVP1309_22 [uncultured Caudovirales phage]|uniref:Uncharacterized protein n=1 Tax=uncultured Caudovirales phage TaxID=2100421 RepID=A0A6J5RKV3_9CAUD|nr:hypothetical protein UFOVP1309_22 [uncultured Caudovirales phage]